MKNIEKKISVPSDIQYEWHRQERTMFITFSANTWCNKERDDLSVPLSEINPVHLNTDQWCQAALAWGAKEILFVAKHIGGFCWWQTESTDYSVKNTPWKNGKGDILADLSKSCKKYGLNLGVYVHPGDVYHGAYVGGGGLTSDPSLQEKYNKAYRIQLEEVLSNYGEMIEIWFDGSNILPIDDIMEKYSKNSVIFQSPFANIRWVGNEKGYAPYPSWSAVDKKLLLTGRTTARHGHPDGDSWAPIEVDTPLHDHSWFWSKENELKRKTLDKLVEIYYTSVGRGAVFLLNAAPNTDGLIPRDDMELYDVLGKEIKRRFSLPLGDTTLKTESALIEFEYTQCINHVIIREDIKYGERIRQYEVLSISGKNSKVIAKGSMVGNCRIEVFEEIYADKLILNITESVGNPCIIEFTAYNVSDIDVISLISALSAEHEVYDNLWNRCTVFEGSESYKELVIDISKFVQYPGEFKIKFEGNVEVDEYIGIINGNPTQGIVQRDENGVFYVNRTAIVCAEDTTGLKVSVKGEKCNIVICPV